MAFEEARSELTLEFLEAAGENRLREADRTRSAAHAAGIRDRDEISQVMELGHFWPCCANAFRRHLGGEEQVDDARRGPRQDLL